MLLFPSDSELRVEVEEVERWGEEDLQQVGRRILLWPAARRLASKVDADHLIGETIAEVPKALAHADELISRGVIGTSRMNFPAGLLPAERLATLTERSVCPNRW